jgi:hypothetical protein
MYVRRGWQKRLGVVLGVVLAYFGSVFTLHVLGVPLAISWLAGAGALMVGSWVALGVYLLANWVIEGD